MKQDIINNSNEIFNKLFLKNFLFPALFLIAVILISYLPILNAGFIWDDNDYVTENQFIKSTDGLYKIWFEIGATDQYYPLVFTSFWIEYHLWGLNTFGYHLINIFIHSFNAIILWIILRNLSIQFPYLLALIFAVHPVQAESVCWITERKNILSGFFYLLSLYFFLRYLNFLTPQEDIYSKTNRKKNIISKDFFFLNKFYILSFLLYICALLSKTVTFSLPLIIIILIWWRRAKTTQKDIVPLIPFFIAGIFLSLITVWVERHKVGAIGEEWNFSFIERILIAGRALLFYPQKILIPYKLTFIYPRWIIDAKLLWQFIYPIVAAAIFILLFFFKNKIGKAPFTATLCYAITMFPALGFFNVYPMRYSFVADHFQYHGSIFLIVLFASIISYLLIKYSPIKLKIYLPHIIFSIIIIILISLTYKQCRIYKNTETLWLDTIAKNPNAGIAHNNLANIYMNRQQSKEAMYHYSEAVRLMPHDEVLHYNMANALTEIGKLDEAEEYYMKSISINPYFAEAHNNLGNISIKMGKIKQALNHFNEAINIKSNMANPHFKLGDIYLSQGKIQNAVEEYYTTLRLDPNLAEAANNLAWILATNEKFQNPTEAVKFAEMSVKITNGKLSSALDTLGAAYASAGRFQDAVDAAAKAYNLSLDMKNTTISNGIKERMNLYKVGKPYIEKSQK